MAAGEDGGDPGYDGSNTTGFVSPASDALEGPIDLAPLLDLRRPHPAADRPVQPAVGRRPACAVGRDGHDIPLPAALRHADA